MAASKYKKGPTKEEKEALNKKKKFESKWINKNCFDLSPFRLSRADLSLKQLKFGTIESHNLQSVQIDLDTIKLKSSWIEFIVLMLSQVIDEHTENFKELLGKYQVTNPNFCVEKIYGSYSFDRQGYQVYKIFDTDYYLEAKIDSRTIFNAMVSLIRLLEIDPASMRFNVVSKSIENKPEELLKEKLNYKTDTSTIDEVEQRLIAGEHLAYIKFFGEITEVHRMDIALLAFCNILYDKYGMAQLMQIQNDEETGICLNEISTEYPCSRIRNSLLLVYTSGKEESILAFMQNAVDKLNIANEIIFGFKVQEGQQHEWEVD